MESSNEEQSSFLRENFSLSVVQDEDEEDSESAQLIGGLEPEVIIGELSEEEASEDRFSPSIARAWSLVNFQQQSFLPQHISDDVLDACDHSDPDESKNNYCNKKCLSCMKICKNLKVHICNTRTEKSFPCEVCGKHLSSQSALNSHTNLHLGEKYACEICNVSLTTKKAYVAHQLINHDVKSFACKFCDKKFGKKQHLDEHLRVHLDIRPFVCEICNKSFTRKAHLDLHKEGHFPQYKCELCSKVFTRKGQLKEHVRIHTGERPFKCEVCGKQYARKTRLKYHKCEGLVISSGGDSQPQLGVVCEVCNKRFVSEEDLELHKEMHIPRFKCDVCERLFTRKAQLVEHERIHSGNKPFKCEKCGKDYTRKIRLKRHSCKPFLAAKGLKTEKDETTSNFYM